MNKKGIDYPIMFITLLLVCIGVVMVFSASFITPSRSLMIATIFLRGRVYGQL